MFCINFKTFTHYLWLKESNNILDKTNGVSSANYRLGMSISESQTELSHFGIKYIYRYHNKYIYSYQNWVRTILKQNARRSPDHVNFKTFLHKSVQFKNIKLKKKHCTTNSLGYELGWSCDKIPCTQRIFTRFYHVRKTFIPLSLTF